VTAPPTPISAATEQQQHDNNNQDQFHRNSPLTPTSVRRAPRIQRRRQAIVPTICKSRPTCILGCEQFSSGLKTHSRRSSIFSMGFRFAIMVTESVLGAHAKGPA
jgi:hypothetical protein